MKFIAKLLALSAIALTLGFTACAQNTKNATKATVQPIMQKEATLEMSEDSVYSRLIADLDAEIIKQKMELATEALTTISETQYLLKEIDNGNKTKAIEVGKKLIGSLEVLLTKDPSMALLPVDVRYKKQELITDIETIIKTTKLAQEAMDNGYYQLAADLLEGMRSEMVISTFLIPTATYPDAIKAAVILLEKDRMEEAKSVMRTVLSTIVIEKTILPLPVLKAEQMIIEAALIDAENHDNKDKVINLLKNADYQLTLAEEMGYGKKHKTYQVLAESIEALKKSVESGEDSQSKFDSLKAEIRRFMEKVFPAKK